MTSKAKQKPTHTTDGICRNDRMIQTSCTTAHRVMQKVKGKPSHPETPTTQQWQ